MVKPFIVLFFLSLQLRAADCPGLRDGEVVRLDVPGKSLANFKVFDQDGLGVCASTAASLLLQSVLPDNPRLSYMQLAALRHRSDLDFKRQELISSNAPQFSLYAKKVEEQNKAVNPNQRLNDGWDISIEGAYVCDVIAEAKLAQAAFPHEGICRSEAVNFEKFAGQQDSGWGQRKSVLAISKYMNEFQQRFGEALTVKENPDYKKDGLWRFITGKRYSWDELERNEKVRRQYQEFQQAFNRQLDKKQLVLAEECKSINEGMLAPLLRGMLPQLLAHSYCDESKFENLDMCVFRKKMMTIQQLPGGEMRAEIKKDFLNSLMRDFSTGKATMGHDDVKAQLRVFFQKELGKSFDAYMLEHVGIALDQITPFVLNKSLLEINEVRTQGSSYTCTQRRAMEYLTSDEFIREASQDKVLCNTMGLLENVKDVITHTALTGMSDVSKVRNFLLTNANANFDEAMMDLYAQDCTSVDKVKIPEGLTCNNIRIDKSSSATAAQVIVNELKNNRALTGGFCAAILDKPKSAFAPGECGYHAVGITGVQCVDGKMKYLIQNSWGLSSILGNPAVVQETPARGTYWLDEELFFDGFYQLQVIGTMTK